MLLLERIIKSSCPDGGVIVDPFAGSGTTGVAAMNKKVKSIMIELNPEFCDIMEKRFNVD